MDPRRGGNARDEEADGRPQPSLLLVPGKMTEVLRETMFASLPLNRRRSDKTFNW